MKRLMLALFAVLLALSGCGLSVRKEVRQHHRFLHGDVYVAPITPQPIVEGQPDTYAEADITSVSKDTVIVSSVARKNIGRMWNEAGGCSAWAHFPPEAHLEYRVRSLAGDCTQFGQPNLPLEKDIEATVLVGSLLVPGFIRHTIDRDNDQDLEVCEEWAQTNDIRLVPGSYSKKLRLVGGKNYTVKVTKTRSTGEQPYNVYIDLNPDPGSRETYKGKRVSWSWVNTGCGYYD